jgi:hypothetical protein
MLGDEVFVFNIVWTGIDFTYLRNFVASQIANSNARFRFVANGCPPDQIELMEAFASRHAGRIVEVLDVHPFGGAAKEGEETRKIVAHGVALDRVRQMRDDGPYFCLIDPDIKANAPFVPEFAQLLDEGAAAVTSGKEVWSDDNLVPLGHTGVAGEHFFDRSGFVFGSPHVSLYDRATLDETTNRWGVGLGSAGPELTDAAKAELSALGLDYIIYDTGKLVNTLLQVDGHRLVHRDLPQLVHIGGMSHYLSPPDGHITLANGEQAPDFARWGLNDRYHVTKFTAHTLKELVAGRAAPAIPDGTDPPMARKLRVVQREMTELFARYNDW